MITKNGRPAAVIVIPKDAGMPVKIAARDLQNYVRRISSAQLPIMDELSFKAAQVKNDTTIISVGRTGDKRLKTDDALMILVEHNPGGRPRIKLSGHGDVGAMYAVYAFIEKLGVRFFHPEQEYIPERSDLKIDVSETVQLPAFKWRGIQQHTLHPIEYTDILMARPTDKNLHHAYRYVEWLAKNRQNYLFWWWVDLYGISERREYVGKIVRYAHDRGVKVGLVVGMPFRQQHSYNLLKCDPCLSDTAKWTECLHQGIDEIASLGLDAMCIFFGENESRSFKQPEGCLEEASPVKGTVERIEAVRAYVKSKYPNIFLTLWVHPTAGTPGDDTCPRYFFLPKLCSSDIGAAVHTTMFYDLINPAPTYGNKDFSALREFALEQTEHRPVWYWPETSYWCGFDIDLPLYFPLYIKSRWLDANLLAGKIEGHITFSSGLEWMYWLNDYAVARFAWDPKTFGVNEVLGSFASIFGTEVASVVKSSLNDVILANELYLLKRSNNQGHNLMDILSASASRRGIGNLEGESAVKIRDFQTAYLPDLRALAMSYSRAFKRLQAVAGKVGPLEKPWFNELLDTFEIANLRCIHQLKAYEAVSKFALEGATGNGMPFVSDKAIADIVALQVYGRKIVDRRQTGYRFPHETDSPYYRYLPTVAEWVQTTDYLASLTSSQSFFLKEGMIRPIRSSGGRLEVVGDVGLTCTVSLVVPDDYPIEKRLRLMLSVSDTDSASEGVMILSGKEYPLPMSGDSEKVQAKFDLPPGTFRHGENRISFRFNDNVGGTTRGFYAYSIILAVPKGD